MIERVFGGGVASDEAVVLALVEAVDRVRGISRARLADLLVWAGSPGKVLDEGDLDYPDLTSEQVDALMWPSTLLLRKAGRPGLPSWASVTRTSGSAPSPRPAIP